jgi:glutathione synthase/RimK-type ligase-like ATP-grasp enzyme
MSKMKKRMSTEMGRIRVFPYKQGSRSAKALADALGGKVLKRENSKYLHREDDLVINWGASDSPYEGRTVANQPSAIFVAQNKLTCFQTLLQAGVRVPAFWTDEADIEEDVTFPIVCRTLLTASEGRGIVIAEEPHQLVPAPLYTQYIKKKDEYRVHVLRTPGAADATVIAVQRKAKRNGVEADFKVRNLKNGFVFVRDNVNPPADVIEQAKQSIIATGLAFGAVDVIWNEHQQQAYVLEINTAPGLEGQTVEDYKNAFLHL